jgi:hypothetical protein
MVLAIMELERFLGKVRGEAGGFIGKLGECERHLDFLLT